MNGGVFVEPIIDTSMWIELKQIVLNAIGWMEGIILFDIDFADGYNLRLSLWAFLFSAFCFGVLWDGFMSLYQQSAGGGDE